MKSYIVNMKNRRSIMHPNMIYGKGYALYVDDEGYLSLDGHNVYIPRGGRKALQAIAASGLNNPALSFIHP